MAAANSTLYTIHYSLAKRPHSSLPTWIWYPGDFEIWLGNIFNNRRTERGCMLPPFWKQDSHWPTVEFVKTVDLEADEQIDIFAEGHYNLAVDGHLQQHTVIPAGHHRISIKVWNQATPPAIYVSGPTIRSDASWMTTYEDKIWIDENGQAHGAGIYVKVGKWNFDSPDTPPSQYRLLRHELHPSATESISDSGMLYDFGREVFGYLKLRELQGTVSIYYGESREEALDKAHCETLDTLSGNICNEGKAKSSDSSGEGAKSNYSSGEGAKSIYTVAGSKAFRYVYVEREGNASYADVLMDFEYAPSTLPPYPIADATMPIHSGSFRCSDDELNRIWKVAAYTLDLTTREFFMDGIKRDRWTWSGDAIQSYLMNYYLRFDTECVKRTIRQLRGKDPVTAHVNTIMDYTFYWFKSILDYYDYTADADFVAEMWPRMVSLMDYVLSRCNADGMAEGQADDWIFVDWTDFSMHKRGALCFEQILLCKALQTMAECAEIVDRQQSITDTETANRTSSCNPSDKQLPDYAALADSLAEKIQRIFWSNEHQAYLHAIEQGRIDEQITKFPNMFAILYGLCSEEQQEQIMQRVMLNPDIEPITTPYMRFYELEALCLTGHHRQVMSEMRAYWGGMLREGATTFWEKYVPTESGRQHLAMYGRPYGKSLCHAWGASPVYLLGKYFLGVRPTRPGYEEFEVRPSLGDLEWMEGTVVIPGGAIHIYMDRHCARATTTAGHGTLRVAGRAVEMVRGEEARIDY